MGAPYIYDISRLRVKDLHSATYIYVVRRLRVNEMSIDNESLICQQNTLLPLKLTNELVPYPYISMKSERHMGHTGKTLALI